MLHTKFQLNPTSGSGEKVKNRFSRWPHWITIWITVHLLVATMLHTKFQLNPTSGSGEEVENRFSRWPPWRPYWISNRNDLNNRASTGCPDAPYQIAAQSDKWFWRRSGKSIFKMAAMAEILDIESPRFEQPCIYWLSWCFIPNFSSIRQAVLEKKSKIDFQDGRRGGHIGYWTGMICTTVNLLIAPKVHTKSGVDLLCGSGEEVENAKSLTDGRLTTRHDITSP